MSLVLVRRRDPPLHTHAIPGGFVNIGEDVTNAVIREVFEETGLVIELKDIHFWRVMSDPSRDPRRHTVSLVYRCRVSDLSTLKRNGGDDAKGVELVSASRLPSLTLAFDHRDILRSYLQEFHTRQ